MLGADGQFNADLAVFGRREKYRQKAADNAVENTAGSLGTAVESLKALPRGDYGVVVGNLLVVGVAALANGGVKPVLLHLLCKFQILGACGQAVQVLRDFLCHSRRQHTSVGTRIGDQFLLVKVLHNLQSLVGAHFEEFRALVLQLGKVEEQRRIFLLFFLIDIGYNSLVAKLFEH